MSNQSKPIQDEAAFSTLQVYFFGSLTFQQHGETVSLPDSATARLLLAYLVLNRKRIHSRAVLAGMFWPESSESRARRALSQAIWHIRRRFPDLIEATSETVTLSPPAPIWTDAETFEGLVKPHLTTNVTSETAHNDLRRAVELYQGDLLEGVYDEWALLERERLHELYLQALERLIQLEKAGGNYPQALELTLQLVRVDPLQESTHREAMRLYYLLNQPEAALRQFETCCQVLQDELSLEPEPETVTLAQEIARQSAHDIAPYLPKTLPKNQAVKLESQHPLSIALTGRDEQRTDLLRHVEGIFQQRGGIVLLEGEAGIGKTRLIQEIAHDAEWRNAQVLWGQCREQEASPPFGPLTTALDQGLTPLRTGQLSTIVEKLWLQVLMPLLPQLARHLPDLEPAPALEPDQERARLLEAATNLLTGWATITPLLLIVEDVHWADEDTLSLLPALAQRLSDQRVLVVGTYRGEEARASSLVWEHLQALDRAGLLQRLTLDNLDLDATGELIRRCLGLSQSAPVFEKRIYQETNGNPLFILETLRTLQDEGLLTQNEDGNWRTPWDETTADYAELPLPPLVEQVIARRLGRLSPLSRQVLNAAVILGLQFDFTLLGAVSGLETKELFATLQELLTRHFLEETPDGYRFSHAKIRQVARAEMDVDMLRELHHRAANAAEVHTPDQMDVLAHHYTQAQIWDKAIYYHYRAGLQAAQTYAYTTALTHYDQAISLLEHTDVHAVTHFDLLAAREKALDILGDRAAQTAALEAMLSLAQQDDEKMYIAALRQAWLLTNTSHYDEAQDTARQALSLSKKRKDKMGQAEALNLIGTALTWQGKNEEAIQPLQEAITLAQQSGEHRGEARYRRFLASALLGFKKYDDAKEELDLSLQQAAAQNDLLEQAEIFNLLGIIHMERGISEAAREAYERSLTHCRAIGYLYGEGRALTNLGNLYYFQGQISKTLELYSKAIRIFAQLGQKRGEVQVRLNRASISQNVLGDSQQIIDDAQFALAYARQVGDPLSEGQSLTVLAEASRRGGDLKTARQHLKDGIKKMEECGDRWLLVQEYGVLAQLDIREHLPDQALEHLSYALTTCQELGLSNLEPALIALRGLALLQKEQFEEALQATTEAIGRLKPGVEQAYLIPYWHTQVLTALGRYDEAGAAIQQAYELLQEILAGLSPEQQRTSLERVPEHRAIVEAWQRGQPRQVTVSMPKVGGGDEQVNVTWTIESPADAHIQGKVARRHHRLQRLLDEAQTQGGTPTHQHLADALGVGLRTIERDMAALQKKKKP